MGAKSKADLPGDHPVEMQCVHCDDIFWTDEETLNDCPDCGRMSMTTAGD